MALIQSKKKLCVSAVMSYITISPSPKILIESMRDIGYDLNSAISDLIDNSIAANAKSIHISFEANNESSLITVKDDGLGMSEDELISAMKFGSSDPLEERNKKDLGRFGLGLKTASFSQCRRLTVCTKKIDHPSTSVAWDLDVVREKDDWIAEKLDSSRVDLGTTITWEKLDRFKVDFEDTKYFLPILENLRDHIALTFHRFIEGQLVDKTSIYLQDRMIEPINPFPNHTAAIINEKNTYISNGSTVNIQSYVLPHQNKSTKESYKKLERTEGYRENQGFYIYRTNRLIVHGTWFGLIKKSETTKLCRIKVDVDNSCDRDWRVDIKKSKMLPPKAIISFFKNYLPTIEMLGKNVASRKKRHNRFDEEVRIWNAYRNDSSVNYRINLDHPLVISCLQSPTKHKLEALIFALENSLPIHSIYHDIADGSITIATEWQKEGNDNNKLKDIALLLKEARVKDDDVLSMLNNLLQSDSIRLHANDLKALMEE